SECFHSNARNIDHMAANYPLTQLAVEHQLGIVVHTPEALDVLSRDQNCPIVLAPLPFSAQPGHQPVEKSGPPFRLIIFGYIGRSRRLNSVLRALAEMPEKDDFQLDIYGDILDEEDQLRAQIRELDLKQQVHLHGFASEAKLDEALAHSHLAINLRYPTMGEASGSQLRIWAHALPSLVSRIGWYETLPSDSVAFVRTDENERSDIQNHLRSLAKDQKSFAEMGARGHKVLVEEHSPSRYAQTMIEMARLSQNRRPLVAADRLAERAGVLLSEWGNPNAVVDAAENVPQEIFELSRSTGV